MLVPCLLYGFNGEDVMPKGVITLPTNLGIAPRHFNLMIDLMVVKVPSTCNMILSHPYIKMARVVLSMYYLVMKFPTEAKIREVRGNQVMIRESYFAAIKRK